MKEKIFHLILWDGTNIQVCELKNRDEMKRVVRENELCRGEFAVIKGGVLRYR